MHLPPDFEKYATDLNTKTKNKTNSVELKRVLHVSNFTVCTPDTLFQQSEPIASAMNQRIDMTCIQEHRYFQEDINLKYHNLGKGWALIMAFLWKITSNSTIGGAGILFSPHAHKSLLNIKNISSRIVVTTFSRNPLTPVMACYRTTNASHEDDVIHFYNYIASLVCSVPRHNVLLIAGDMNAHLGGSQYNGHAFHIENNRNGKHCNNFVIESNLYCLNANVFADVSSDHKFVTIKIQPRLRANKKKNGTKKQVDSKDLSNNEDIQNQFNINL